MTNKITKRERFEQLANIIGGANISEEVKAEMLNFIAHEQELLTKKSSKSGQTKTQKANEILKVEMREALANIGKPVTVSEFMSLTSFNLENEFSNQKVSAMLNQLVKAHEVAKTVDKKKSYFSVNVGE